jgi:hypothetical protein
VQPHHQGGEVVDPGGARDDDLAVEDELPVPDSEQAIHDLGEVAGKRPVVPAAHVDGVAVAKGDASEAVPLRLVHDVAARKVPGEAGQHRVDRGVQRPHGRVVPTLNGSGTLWRCPPMQMRSSTR